MTSELKMRPLPDTDLARICGREEGVQRLMLFPFCEANKNFKSYRPARKSKLDIFQTSVSELEMPTSEWEPIERIIRSRARGEIETEMNVRAASALFKGLRSRGASSRLDWSIPANMQLSPERTFSVWDRLLVNMKDIESLGLIPAVDFRVDNGFDFYSRKFAFSMMNYAIREFDPKFKNADFAMISLPLIFRKSRKFKDRNMAVIVDDRNYYSFEQLETMMLKTQKIYRELFEEREEKRRAA